MCFTKTQNASDVLSALFYFVSSVLLNEEEDDDGDKVINKTLLLRLQNGKLSETDSTIRHAYACMERSPVWARGRCRISPPRFLAECCKRQLNQVSLVFLYFRLSAFSDLY